MTHAENELLPSIYTSPILIVEDNKINRLFLEKTLKSSGFTTLLSVASGEDALDQMAQFYPEMVILDIMMPGGMDGFECCAAIRGQPRYRDVPVLIQTTLTEPQLRVKAFESGATDFVSKPVYAQELSARVLVHLQKRHALKSLQRYKWRMETEMESARKLQESILPTPLMLEAIRQQCGMTVASYFRPCSEIGGDFWGIKSLFPQQSAVWLVDFAGHGVASALNAFRLQAYMKEFSSLAARAGEYLGDLNEKLLHLLMRGQFATMFYGIIDAQSNQLHYACACAPHPIIFRQATGKAELLDGSGSPLGIGLQDYITQSTSFAMGDVLLLYSDALTESPNAAGDFITEAHLMDILEQHRGIPAAQMVTLIVEYFYEHVGNSALRDDLTIALCMRSANEGAL